MKLSSARRVGAFVTLGVVAALAPAVTPQASAQTATIDHPCSIDGSATTLPVLLNTTAPASSPAGTKIPGKFFAVVTLPAAFVDNLKSQSSGIVKAISGTFQVRMTTDGVSTPATVNAPSTAIPAAAGASMKLTASGPLPAYTPGAPGTVEYKASASNPAINFTLAFLGNGGGELATRDGFCNKPATVATIDTVNITAATPVASKASSRVGTGVIYKKKRKRLIVAGKVVATPEQVVTGKLNFKLFRNGKQIRNVTLPLQDSFAKTRLPGKIGKGRYTLKFKYRGSSTVKASSATRRFVIKG